LRRRYASTNRTSRRAGRPIRRLICRSRKGPKRRISSMMGGTQPQGPSALPRPAHHFAAFADRARPAALPEAHVPKKHSPHRRRTREQDL
jgi:hypothetical protein